MEDNLKELIKMQKKKYEIVLKVEELQKIIDLIEQRHSCVIYVRGSDTSGIMDEKFEVGCYGNEDDACGDIIEALKVMRDKRIKVLEELDTEVKKRK
jgi:hypothetical protein